MYIYRHIHAHVNVKKKGGGGEPGERGNQKRANLPLANWTKINPEFAEVY